MKIVFAGTPEFAATALNAIIHAGHTIKLVLTQPDRPSGRGMKLQPSAVKKLALSHAIPVKQPVSLRFNDKNADAAKEVYECIQEIAPDVMVVAAYGLILPKAFLDLPKYGAINIHASLLPRWRGAAPIQRAIEAGDTETGISIMQMDIGLDTGPVLAKKAVPIDRQTNAAALHDTLAELGGQLILSVLHDLQKKPPYPVPQDAQAAIYAPKIRKEEAALDFSHSATKISNKIRAFNPFPGCTGKYKGSMIKIWQAEVDNKYADHHANAGQILSADNNGIVIACGSGATRILELQKPGSKRLPVSEFIKGFSFDNTSFE